MLLLSEYMDYRQYLKDFYETMKSNNPYFSYEVFSKKAGISSKGLLYNVIHGKRHLSKSHVIGIGQAMKFNKSQLEYFENLVAYNCAKNVVDQKYYFERLISIKTSDSSAWQPQLVRKEQYKYYSQWYYSAIRSLIGMFGFSGDFRKLAKLLRPTITSAQVKKTISLLESLGLIARDDRGYYSLVDKSIATTPEVVSLAILNYHMQSGEIALRALRDVPKSRRNFTSVTLGISHETYVQICKEVDEFRSRLIHKAELDKTAEVVYQINFQIFPLSDLPADRSPS